MPLRGRWLLRQTPPRGCVPPLPLRRRRSGGCCPDSVCRLENCSWMGFFRGRKLDGPWSSVRANCSSVPRKMYRV
jgi:hypothetical protein